MTDTDMREVTARIDATCGEDITSFCERIWGVCRAGIGTVIGTHNSVSIVARLDVPKMLSDQWDLRRSTSRHIDYAREWEATLSELTGGEYDMPNGLRLYAARLLAQAETAEARDKELEQQLESVTVSKRGARDATEKMRAERDAARLEASRLGAKLWDRMADVERLRRERDAARDGRDVYARWRDEDVGRLRPVVEAACALRDEPTGTIGGEAQEAAMDLFDAVDAYRDAVDRYRAETADPPDPAISKTETVAEPPCRECIFMHGECCSVSACGEPDYPVFRQEPRGTGEQPSPEPVRECGTCRHQDTGRYGTPCRWCNRNEISESPVDRWQPRPTPAPEAGGLREAVAEAVGGLTCAAHLSGFDTDDCEALAAKLDAALAADRGE